MTDERFPIEIDGIKYSGAIVPATREDAAPGDEAIYDDGTIEIIDEWITLRCAVCGHEANSPKPADVAAAAANPDGTYRSLCPSCSDAKGYDAPLNRAARRAQRKLN